MDGPIPESERKQEEVLMITPGDVSQRAVLSDISRQHEVEGAVLCMPCLGLTQSQQVISLHYDYTYSPQKSEVNPNTNLININYNDHALFHLIPSKFAFYDRLMKHELIKFNRVTIVSYSTSGYDSTTTAGFFPVTKDTSGMKNASLLQMCKKLELDPEEKMTYTIRYVAPEIIKYTQNDKDQVTSVKLQDPYLEPNKVIKVDYLKKLQEANKGVAVGGEQEDLSYGSVVMIKQNVSDQIIGMSFTVNMYFDCWDYVINGCRLDDIQDKNLDGDTTDEGEGGNGGDDDNGEGGNGNGNGSAPRGATRISRRVKKN